MQAAEITDLGRLKIQACEICGIGEYDDRSNPATPRRANLGADHCLGLIGWFIGDCRIAIAKDTTGQRPTRANDR